MPRLHLHIHDGAGLIQDEEGREFASIDDARQSAVQSARELLSEELAQGLLKLAGWIEIADAQGRFLDRVSFRDVVRISYD